MSLKRMLVTAKAETQATASALDSMNSRLRWLLLIHVPSQDPDHMNRNMFWDLPATYRAQNSETPKSLKKSRVWDFPTQTPKKLEKNSENSRKLLIFRSFLIFWTVS